MQTRWWRMVRIMVTMLSLTMLVGLAGPASAQPSDAKTSCKKGGWETLVQADGTPFRNQGDCVSYVAADGGVPVPPALPVSAEIQLVMTGLKAAPDNSCTWRVDGSGLDPNITYNITTWDRGGRNSPGTTATPNADGTISVELGSSAPMITDYQVRVYSPNLSTDLWSEKGDCSAYQAPT